MHDVAQDREVLTPPRKNVRETAPLHEVPADDESGRSASSSEGTAVKQTAALGQACCRSIGIELVERDAARKVMISKDDASSMVRLRIPPHPPAKGQEAMVPNASPDYLN